MKKSVRFIAIALAFCTVFSIAAFAIQVASVHTYNEIYYEGTTVDCHGYLNSSIIHFPEEENVEVWASTEVSERTSNINRIQVWCTFYNVSNTASLGTHTAIGSHKIATTINNPVVGPLLAYAEAVHEVEYMEPDYVMAIATWHRKTEKQLRDYLV